MASETKRPERPARRKSDVPLETNRFLDDSSPRRHGQAAKVGSDMTCILGTLDGKDEGGAVAENLEDLSLQIVEECDLRPTRPAPPVPVVSGGSAQPALRPVRPKDRHKTISSQFPAVELSKKEEKVELGNRRCVEFLRPSLDSHSSTGAVELSSPKPVIKPKPLLHCSSLSVSNVLNNKDAGNNAVVQDQSEISSPAVQSGMELSGNQPNSDQTASQKSSSHENTGQRSSGQQSTSQQNSGQQISGQQSDSQHNTGQTRISESPRHESVSSMQPRIPVSSDENVLQMNADVSDPDVPLYAQVDKTKKLKKRSSYDDQIQSAGLSDVTPQNESALIRANTVSSGTVGGACSGATGALLVPPKKPPRTFAHTEYMRLKAREREGRAGSASVSATIESEYEEIENPDMKSGKMGLNSTDDGTNLNLLESTDPTKSDPVKRRSTGDKLPAPPRPPPPSVVQKTGTLPAKRNGESSPVAETFQRGSPNFRNSDRSFFRDKRKSKSPEPLKISVQQKKPSEKKTSSDKRSSDARPFRGKLEEDIYAEPNEVRRVGLSPALESPIEDPLYEVPGTGNRPRCATAATDACGYAAPDVRMTPTRQMSAPCSTAPQQPRKGNPDAKSIQTGSNNRYHQTRISSAYSILRLNVESEESGHENVENADEDSDVEVTKDEQERRLKHISNVRKRTSHWVANYVRLKLNEPIHLFDFALIVGIRLDEDKKCHPQVLFQYPEKLSNGTSADRVELFCFPDAEIWRPVTIYDGEMFSFVLTNEVGVRQYGYCRRLLPPGNGNRLPAALCVVSSIGEVCIYEQLLRSVEERFMVCEEQAEDLLRAAYSHLCPAPNREVVIVMGPDSKKQTVILRRAGESRPDVVSCDALLTYLSTSVLIKVFGSVLLERRLIFCAQKLSTLTSCVHTILALIYPFEWQHVFVPVLPSCMTDILDSPTPYIIGILSSTYAKLLQKEALSSEVLVIDLDGGSLLRSYGDEEHIIPEKLQKALSTALKDDCDSMGVRDAAVTEAFLRFFIETCGHYTDFISMRPDGKSEFDVEQFTGAVASRSIQMFLEWFVRTQMFEVFMTEELHGVKHDLFLMRIMEYREEMTEMTSSLKQNMKLMRKKIKHFFVESGGKLRRKFQRNVFI